MLFYKPNKKIFDFLRITKQNEKKRKDETQMDDDYRLLITASFALPLARSSAKSCGEATYSSWKAII